MKLRRSGRRGSGRDGRMVVMLVAGRGRRTKVWREEIRRKVVGVGDGGSRVDARRAVLRVMAVAAAVGVELGEVERLVDGECEFGIGAAKTQRVDIVEEGQALVHECLAAVCVQVRGEDVGNLVNS